MKASLSIHRDITFTVLPSHYHYHCFTVLMAWSPGWLSSVFVSISLWMILGAGLIYSEVSPIWNLNRLTNILINYILFWTYPHGCPSDCRGDWAGSWLRNYTETCWHETIDQGSICRDQVSRTKMSHKNKTSRNLHMFLDILKLRIENKNKSLGKTVLIMLSQICRQMA